MTATAFEKIRAGLQEVLDNTPAGAREPLYKYDSKGKLRIWYMEWEHGKHRTVAGLADGKLTTSEWTVCEGKQKRTHAEQALFEINADYEYQLTREYFLTPEEAEGGARFFKPMLAEKWKDCGWTGAMKRIKEASRYIEAGVYTGVWGQPKLDGFCCIAQASGMTSREGEPIISAPHIMEALQPWFEAHPDAVLHGELYNHDLHEDFQQLSSILKKQKGITEEHLAISRAMAQFHIYDYPAPYIRESVFCERYEMLSGHFEDHVAEDGVLHLVATVPLFSDEHVEQQRGEFIDQGYEGQIVRLDIGPYKQGRSWQTLKNKVFDDGEFEVVEIIEGVGNYTGYAKRVTCWMPDADKSAGPTKANTFGAGIKGGQKPNMKIDVFRERGDKWVTIRHFGWTNDGKPRMGVSTVWHGDRRTL
jgi:DNA ligase-1